MTDAPVSSQRFVGRGQTVAVLHRRFDEVKGGFGGVSVLTGNPGLGKSTLTRQLVEEFRARGIRVLIGRALSLDDPPPLAMIQSAIASAHEDPTLRTDENPLLGGDQLMIGFALRLGDFPVPEPVGLEDRLIELLGGSRDRGSISSEKVLAGISERFLEFTRHGPTVLVLEDVDRADESSLAAVEFFAEELRDRPLWILATSRPYTALSEMRRIRLEKFEERTRAQHVALPPMTSSEMSEYIGMTDPSRKLSPEELERLNSEAEGNPLFLQQTQRYLSPRVSPSRAPGSGPPRLDEEAQRILSIAAVLGPEFPFDLLLQASGMESERLAEVVDYLVDRRLLLERPDERFEFADDRLREEAYSQVVELQRRFFHRRAGDALEGMGAPDTSRVYALARHFYLSRTNEKSIQYNRTAARIAEQAFAPEVARDHLARALESQRMLPRVAPDVESELVLDLARVLEELGRLQEAETQLRSFLDNPRDGPGLSPVRRATLEMFLARVLTDRGDLPAASVIATKILSSPGLQGQLLLPIGAHHQLGQANYYDGHFSEALSHHTEELRLAREVGNVLVISRAQIWRVAALSMMGKIEESIAEARAVTVIRDGLGSARESAQAHLFLGDILADARSPGSVREEALQEYASAIQFAETAQDPRRVGWARYKISELLREKGRLDEASESAQRASKILREVGDKVGLSVSIKVLGQISIDRRAFDLAESELTEAYRLLHGLNHILEETDVILRLAQLSVARGNREAARKYVAELESHDLPKIRPDLVGEYEQLQRDLGSGEAKGSAV
ncbi:MAG: AAA family ATPase [Thermoplasmata archaeon]